MINRQMVVTNLRIRREDWLEVKVFAAEMGLSVNKYINLMIEDYKKSREFPRKSKKRKSIWDLAELAKIPNKPMGMSEEDEIIYG